jgi:LPXTG-site transpeptidase (sortase) family protein
MKLTQEKIMKKTQLIILGVIVVGVSTVELFGAANSIAARIPLQHTTPAVAIATNSNTNSCAVNDVNAVAAIPTHITINKAAIDLPVIAVPLQNGTWTVNDGVGNYALETSRVSDKTGNVGIFGHDRSNAFTKIKVLRAGDVITVTTAGGEKATYAVKSTEVTNPTSVEAFYPTKTPTLTLVTCDGFFSEQRYVVKANLVSLQKGSCNAKTV